MLTITPTAVLGRSQSEDLEVFAVIDGRKVFLPEEARYVMQDCRGLWFYSKRKPRLSEGDWTPNKTSIACVTDRGRVRVLQTEPASIWLETCQRTIRMVARDGQRRPAEDAV